MLQEFLQDYHISQYPPSVSSFGAIYLAWQYLINNNPELACQASQQRGPEVILQPSVDLRMSAGFSQNSVVSILNSCISELTRRQDILKTATLVWPYDVSLQWMVQHALILKDFTILLYLLYLQPSWPLRFEIFTSSWKFILFFSLTFCHTSSHRNLMVLCFICIDDANI